MLVLMFMKFITMIEGFSHDIDDIDYNGSDGDQTQMMMTMIMLVNRSAYNLGWTGH